MAIAVDATVIRGLLVSATMALLDTLNWWTPTPAVPAKPARRPDAV